MIEAEHSYILCVKHLCGLDNSLKDLKMRLEITCKLYLTDRRADRRSFDTRRIHLCLECEHLIVVQGRNILTVNSSGLKVFDAKLIEDRKLRINITCNFVGKSAYLFVCHAFNLAFYKFKQLSFSIHLYHTTIFDICNIKNCQTYCIFCETVLKWTKSQFFSRS